MPQPPSLSPAATSPVAAPSPRPSARVIRVFAIPPSTFDLFKAYQRQHQQAADRHAPGRQITNSESFQMLMAEYHQLRGLAQKLASMVQEHLLAEHTGRASTFSAAGVMAAFDQMGSTIEAAHIAVINAPDTGNREVRNGAV